VLAANERDRNVPHGRIGLGAMPMALASLDVRRIADVDLALLMLRRHESRRRCTELWLRGQAWPIVVKPVKRGGHIPNQLMTKGIPEAKPRSLPESA